MVLFRLYETLGQAEQAQACRVELRGLAATAYAPLLPGAGGRFPLRWIVLASL